MDYKILLFPDGTAVGKAPHKSDGTPVRTSRPRFARIFTTESKRQNYRHEFAHLNLRSAILRIDVIEENNETT